jgi:hypothetical protein
LSTLSCPLRELIAVTDKTAPNLECYLHGNLPSQGSPFAEESESVSEERVASVKSPRKNESSAAMEYKRSTRVDVDSQGRRALVNDMR